MSLLNISSSAFKAVTHTKVPLVVVAPFAATVSLAGLFSQPITTLVTRNIIPSFQVEQDTKVPILNAATDKKDFIKYWYKDAICILTEKYRIIPLLKLSPTALQNISPVYSSTNIKIPAVIKTHQSAVEMLQEMKEAEEDADKAGKVGEVRGDCGTMEECKTCVGCRVDKDGNNIGSMRDLSKN